MPGKSGGLNPSVRVKVQWHTLSRWFANVEIYICLFVAFGCSVTQDLARLGERAERPPFLELGRSYAGVVGLLDRDVSLF